MVSSNDHAERRPSHKATLYCPTCSHANRINGDWMIHVRSDRLDYECPECGSVIDSRPDGSELNVKSDGVFQFGDAD